MASELFDFNKYMQFPATGGQANYDRAFATDYYSTLGNAVFTGNPLAAGSAIIGGTTAKLKESQANLRAIAADPQGAMAATGVNSDATASGGIGAAVADYFLRAVIIILGFIFVAVGLSMFRALPVPLPPAAQAVKKIIA